MLERDGKARARGRRHHARAEGGRAVDAQRALAEGVGGGQQRVEGGGVVVAADLQAPAVVAHGLVAHAVVQSAFLGDGVQRQRRRSVAARACC